MLLSSCPNGGTTTYVSQGAPVPVEAAVGPAYLEAHNLAGRLPRHLGDQHDARVLAAAPVCDGLVDVEPAASRGAITHNCRHADM